MTPDDPLLQVRDLRVAFGGREVVRGVDLTLAAGECLAVVGESGSGKSVTARSLIGLAGERARVGAERMELGGRSLLGLGARAWRDLRGREIGFISQDALVSLDPLRPVGREIADALRLHTRMTSAERRQRVIDVLAEVGMPDPELRAGQRPGELSGGQRQRALIASAIALEPSLVIADEPTTALDVTVQAQVLEVLAGLRRRGAAILLISHDLAVVRAVADRVAVMDDGVIVEEGPVARVLGSPQSPRTRRLIAAVPFGRPRGTRLSVPGDAPAAVTAPRGPIDAATAAGPPAVVAISLTKRFRLPGGATITAADEVSFALARGRTLGLVGESSSGKSTTARLVLALTRPDSGEVRVDGGPWSELTERQRRPLRPGVGAVFQDALSSFDPRLTVAQILADAVLADEDGRRDRRRRIESLLDLVHLPADVLERRPLRLSGGQRQRVGIARALATRPRILVCDEPVSALDVSVQATVLDLLDDLQRDLGLSYLFISHDLGVIQHVSDDVAVMRDGRIVETGPAERVFRSPEHPYTRALLDAAPRLVD